MNRGKHRYTGAARAAVMVFALCRPFASYGADTAERPTISYQEILNIGQAGNMVQGRPQNNPIQNETVSAVQGNTLQNGEVASEIVIRDSGGQVIERISAADRTTVMSALKSTSVVSKYSSRSTEDDDEDDERSSGPGASPEKVQLEVRDDSKTTGPEVREVTMSETYHQDYDIYTESIDGRFFIYTNVSNRGITDQPVYLDIPQGISFTAEKDGVPIAYTANQRLTERGTYLFHFTAIKDESKPLSQQVIYETTFHFRIQEKSEKVSQASGEMTYYGSSHSTQLPYPVPAESRQTAETEAPEALTETGAPEELDVSADRQAEEEPEPTAPEGEQERGVSEEEQESEAAEETEGLPLADKEEGTGGAEEASGGIEISETASQYDQQTGMYRISAGSQRYFLSSVPNGMLSNAGVYVDLSGLLQDEGNVAVLQDGEPYSMPEDGTFNQVGSYTLRIPDNGKISCFSFRIISGSASGLDSYTVPREMTVIALTRNGEDILGDQAQGGQHLDFREDGEYSMTLENQQGVRSQVTVVIDHVAPRLNISLLNQTATLSYDQEVVRVDVTSSRGTESYENLRQVNGPGTFLVEVYDAAGNSTAETIVIPKKVNMAAVIAVILLIGLGAGAVIFIQKTKKDFNVK
ncbi:MAG: hypothetical protein Q4P20_10755 [Eubacteriales bacterium]|nr:hypothetical protein [Eubacteriales bacterium]